MTPERIRELRAELGAWPAPPWVPDLETEDGDPPFTAWTGCWLAEDPDSDEAREIDGSSFSDYPDEFSKLVASLVTALPEALESIERMRQALVLIAASSHDPQARDLANGALDLT